MTDFVTLDIDDLGVDRIATSPTAFALYENLFAFAEKAVGAPVLANNYIVAAMIAASQITTAKIADANVTAAKLATGTNERDWVLARNAAASVGALGTYALLRTSGSSVAQGTNVAGSGLLYANSDGGVGPSTAPSGTWQSCGRADTSGTNAEATTLWLRVA